MPPSRSTLIVPILLIAVGLGWLLTNLKIIPGMNWAWTLGLAGIGIVILVVGGIDKVNVVIGPFFIAASLLSFLRQTGRMNLDVETPLLVMILGGLMMWARSPTVAVPIWFTEQDPNKKQS